MNVIEIHKTIVTSQAFQIISNNTTQANTLTTSLLYSNLAQMTLCDSKISGIIKLGIKSN